MSTQNELEISLSQASFAPGELIRGKVSWRTETPPRKIVVKIGWFTEGRGTEDAKTEHRQEWFTEFRTGDEAFEFQLPPSPYSFSGKLIELIWCVNAETDDGKLFVRKDFVVAPERELVSI